MAAPHVAEFGFGPSCVGEPVPLQYPHPSGIRQSLQLRLKANLFWRKLRVVVQLALDFVMFLPIQEPERTN